jgi:hypothetical protein
VRSETIEIVGRENNRDPVSVGRAFVEIGEHVKNFVTGPHINTSSRFIKNQHVGLLNERSRQEHSLLLPA